MARTTISLPDELEAAIEEHPEYDGNLSRFLQESARLRLDLPSDAEQLVELDDRVARLEDWGRSRWIGGYDY